MFIGITGLTNLRHASDKKSKKSSKISATTVKPEECSPKQAKQVQTPPPIINNPPKPVASEPKCDLKASGKAIPPMCEEICGPIPPGGSSTGPPSIQKYWKQILAALIIAGVTVYALTKADYVKEKVSNSPATQSKTKKKDKEKKGKIRIPANSLSIPPEVPYLLIGGGTAAFSAFRSIKSKDPKAKVRATN